MKNKKNRIFFLSISALFLIILLFSYLIIRNHPRTESWQMQIKCQRLHCQQELKTVIKNQSLLPSLGFLSFYSPDMENYDPKKFRLHISENIPFKKQLESQKPFYRREHPEKLFFFFLLPPKKSATIKISATQTIQDILQLPTLLIQGQKNPETRQYRIELDPDYRKIENNLKIPSSDADNLFIFSLTASEKPPLFKWKYQELFPVFGFMG